jgi:hypothetical protein
VIQLLCEHKSLLAPLFSECTEHVLHACQDASDALTQHSSACIKATFAAVASFLEQVLSSKVLQSALLGVKKEASDLIIQLATLARDNLHLSGVLEIKAQTTLLEQKLQDIYSGM